ncbi:MAG: hypothetical protein ACTSV7_00820 [Candidatus Baldrarchaeia archaeon]
MRCLDGLRFEEKTSYTGMYDNGDRYHADDFVPKISRFVKDRQYNKKFWQQERDRAKIIG